MLNLSGEKKIEAEKRKREERIEQMVIKISPVDTGSFEINQKKDLEVKVECPRCHKEIKLAQLKKKLMDDSEERKELRKRGFKLPDIEQLFCPDCNEYLGKFFKNPGRNTGRVDFRELPTKRKKIENEKEFVKCLKCEKTFPLKEVKRERPTVAMRDDSSVVSHYLYCPYCKHCVGEELGPNEIYIEVF